MTKAQKLIDEGPLTLDLHAEKPSGTSEQSLYVAEFKPGYTNPLHIRDVDYKEDADPSGNIIALSYESAVELAEFLKHFFLDEDSEN